MFVGGNKQRIVCETITLYDFTLSSRRPVQSVHRDRHPTHAGHGAARAQASTYRDPAATRGALPADGEGGQRAYLEFSRSLRECGRQQHVYSLWLVKRECCICALPYMGLPCVVPYVYRVGYVFKDISSHIMGIIRNWISYAARRNIEIRLQSKYIGGAAWLVSIMPWGPQWDSLFLNYIPVYTTLGKTYSWVVWGHGFIGHYIPVFYHFREDIQPDGEG